MLLSDLPFEMKISEDVINLSKAFVSKEYGKPYDRSMAVATYAVICTDGTVAEFVNDICHGKLGYYPVFSREAVVTLIDLTQNNFGATPDEMKLFLDYYYNRSFASRFIIPIENGVIVSADIPAPLMQSICIVARHFREVSFQSFRLFNQYKDEYGEEFCYHLFFNSSISTSRDLNGNFGDKNSHRAFPIFRNAETLDNLLKRNYVNLEKFVDIPYRKNNGMYGGSSFGFVKGRLEDNLLAVFMENRKDNSEIKNPFSSSTYTAVTCKTVVNEFPAFLRQKGLI